MQPITQGKPRGFKKGQMYDRHKASNRRLANEARRLRRKYRESFYIHKDDEDATPGLSPGDAARLRRVSGRAAKVNYQEVVGHSYDMDED